MRVVYVQPGEVLGGAERQAVVYISRMRELGHQVLPVVGPSDAIPRALEREGVTDYVHLNDFFHPTFDRGRTSPSSVLSDLRSGLRYFGTQREVARLVRRHAADVIVASRFFGWSVATPVAKRLRVPIVWRAGGCLTTKAEEIGLRLFARVWPPDALVCNSHTVQAGLAAQVECPSYLIRNAVDTVRFDATRTQPSIRHELGLGPATPVLCLVARPRPNKNLEFLAEVLRRTVQQVPDVRLLIAGDSATGPRWARFDWRQHYEALYTRLGLAGRVTFLGHRDDVERVYRSSDVAVLTSRSEGCPNAVLEAMAMERPVVTSQVAGIEEIVEHGVHGYLVPADDAGAYSARLVELLRSPELRTRMGTAGRATILERFGDLASTQRLVALLQSVVAAANGSGDVRDLRPAQR